MTRPLFTIITATFNVSTILNIAAASIRRQNRKDIEYIIVDGGSSDDTLKIIDRNRDVITKVVSEPDDGIYDAINKGIGLATGRYIGVIGADDEYEAGVFDTLQATFERHNVDLVAGQTLMVSDDRSELRVDEQYGAGMLASGIPFGHNAMFASRRAYQRVGLYDTSYRLTADAQWVHRAYEAGMTMQYINEVVVKFKLSGASSHNPDLIMSEADRTIRENFPFLSFEEARTTLACVRGWAPPEHLKPLLARHSDEAYRRSLIAAFASRASNPLDLAQVLPESAPTPLPSSGVPTLPIRQSKQDDAEDRFPTLTALKAANARKPEPRLSAHPVFSFIVPAYNAADFIGAALNSILTQPFTDLEIIVVDDGSTDATPDLLAGYQAADPRVRVHKQANMKQGAARSAGLGLARGAYVWCVDSDDYIQASVLSRLAPILAHEKPDVVQLNFAYVEEDGAMRFSDRVPGNLAGKLVDPRESEETFLAVSAWSSPPWRYIIRRSLIENPQIRFPSNVFYEDHPFALALMLRAERVFVDSSVSYFYVQRTGSTMNIMDDRVFDFIKIRRQCLDLLKNQSILKSFTRATISYCMPFEFIKAHVAANILLPFIIRLADDITDDERVMIEEFGGRRERRLLAAALDLRDHGDVSQAALMEILHSCPEDVFGAQRVARGVVTTGMNAPEGPYPDQGLPEVFQWMDGGELEMRPTRKRKGKQTLTLSFRNIVDNQVLEVFVNGLPVERREIKSADRNILEHCEIQIGSDVELTHRITLRCRTYAAPHKILGLLIEDISLADAHGVAMAKEIPKPLVLVGQGSDASHAAVDVRLNPEPRTYLAIGRDSQIAGRYVFERGLGKVTIGDRSSIGHGCLFICAQEGGISIGSNVMLSWDVTLMDNDAHSLDPEVRENDAFDWFAGVRSGQQGIFKSWSFIRSGKITIEDGAWIGFGATILKDVTIGKGAVVGSKAVVSRSVPAYTAFAGNPARFVRLVPRAQWPWDELIAAAAAAPAFAEALAAEYLEADPLKAYARLLASPDWAWLCQELKAFAPTESLSILHIGMTSGVFAAALASLGHSVTLCVDAAGDADVFSAAKALMRELEKSQPTIIKRVIFHGAGLDALADLPAFDVIHSRRGLQQRPLSKGAFGALTRALAGGGLFVADRDGLLARDGAELPAPLRDLYPIPNAKPEVDWEAILAESGLEPLSAGHGIELFKKAPR